MEEVDISHEALVRELSEASLKSHKIAAAMCLYRVLPVLVRRSASDVAAVAPLHDVWYPAAVGDAILPILEVLRSEAKRGIDSEFTEIDEETEEIFAMASEMVNRAFVGELDVRQWSDWCSSLCLDIHQAFDALIEEADSEPRFYPAGRYPDLTELQACELEDQVRILRLLRDGSSSDGLQVAGIAEAGKERVAASLEQVLGDRF